MSYLSVVKFDQHQHYKNRRPPWVKFYVSLLDVHHPLNALPIPTRYLFDRLLLLAADYDNAIPNDPELIAKLLRMPPRACREGLTQLLKGRWIKETRTKRRASKAASDFAPIEAERETEIIKSSSRTSTNGHYAIPEIELAKLLVELTDKDDRTEQTIRGIARKQKLPQAAFMYARDCATGPGVVSRTKVAVAALKGWSA